MIAMLPPGHPNIPSTGPMRDGYRVAEQTLRDEPRPIREAAARALDVERETAPVNSPRYQQITGALAYIVERRHDS